MRLFYCERNSRYRRNRRENRQIAPIPPRDRICNIDPVTDFVYRIQEIQIPLLILK
ncbi:MAG: hypothetical protein GQF41_1554 [Candidatus Rifleibacterium amylolyticum]|nr:MAG: hypothetical protein GQF41_1554 [Candidatus Rifleibacterium amylolyticum]